MHMGTRTGGMLRSSVPYAPVCFPILLLGSGAVQISGACMAPPLPLLSPACPPGPKLALSMAQGKPVSELQL